MPAVVKPSGPVGAVRPFYPTIREEDPVERTAHALEHIAVVLSGIDNNLQAILREMAKRS